MRFIQVAALIAALAACSERSAPAPTAAEGGEPHALMGRYLAASDTARAITGDVDIERGGLAFASGVVVYTRVLNPRRGGDLIARNGDSYAAATLGPADLIIELRRVTEQAVPAGRVGLCGAEPPQYVALAYAPRATRVTLLVFAGDEPPGPQATQSRVCASFAFDAPDGARTRQGVVL
jgi:hypothetical protein